MNDDIKKYIHQSVLCWLATSSEDNIPNVSPKEIFAYFGDAIIIANIASPQSVRNIKQNPNICVSFIDILVQKGFQLKGEATILTKLDDDFSAMEAELLKLTEGKFPFSEIIKVDINSSKPIIAPKYLLYPETTEAEQIESAKCAYGV
ncbi:pyridoxamine 5'-phosphate oxidase family protein [Hyunsoonleella rubra]|uniref:Pyridoxamine 5'-phosphate oxidase family protein n=1 Tax=Hyunsoonleella rubra TaxID=1737062 RepID=A0ABW5TB09_9FLAO